MIRVVNTKKENDLSFDEIYQEYYRRVFNYAFGRLLHREEAEDATAEVFLVLLQNLQTGSPIMRWKITAARRTGAKSFPPRN